MLRSPLQPSARLDEYLGLNLVLCCCVIDTWGMQMDAVEWEDEEGNTFEKMEWKLAEFITRGKVPLPI